MSQKVKLKVIFQILLLETPNWIIESIPYWSSLWFSMSIQVGVLKKVFKFYLFSWNCEISYIWQTRCCWGLFYKHLHHWFIDSLIHQLSNPFVQNLQDTVRAGELKFWENVHPPQSVTCHMLRVMCQLSRVRCHMSHIIILFFYLDKVVELVGGGSVINGAYPV